jgi:hypothetical protein
LSGALSLLNGLKQEDVSSQLLFNFTLEYAFRKVQENKGELELDGTHPYPAYADDVNLFGENMNIIKSTNSITCLVGS